MCRTVEVRSFALSRTLTDKVEGPGVALRIPGVVGFTTVLREGLEDSLETSPKNRLNDCEENDSFTFVYTFRDVTERHGSFILV